MPSALEMPPLHDPPVAPVVRPKAVTPNPDAAWDLRVEDGSGVDVVEDTELALDELEPPTPPSPPVVQPSQGASAVPAALLGLATGTSRPWWGSSFLRGGGLFFVAFLLGMFSMSPVVLEALGYATKKAELEGIVKTVVQAEIAEAERKRKDEDAEHLRRESEIHAREHKTSDSATARQIELLTRQVETLTEVVKDLQRDGRDGGRRR